MRSLFGLALGLSLFVAAAPHARAEPTPVFRGNMDALAAVLATLLPDALDQRPVDDARAGRLRDGIRALRSVAHTLGVMKAADLPDADPTIGIVLAELGKTADDVARSKPDRLPQTALEVVSACIACHTRTAGPPARIALAPVDAKLPADVRADILAATRRFDEARVAYNSVVFDEAFAARDAWRWERAVRRSLALEVRVADDAKGAAAIVEQVLGTPTAEALWPAASGWQRDVKLWRKETTPEAPFARAARLMNDAVQNRRPAGDASAEILFLRATAALHTLLGTTTTLSKPERAQALAWLGIAYENLIELDVWGLYLSYDAACVDNAPHTPLARTCFARYERAALELFSGNGGAPLPVEMQQRVDELRARAR